MFETCHDNTVIVLSSGVFKWHKHLQGGEKRNKTIQFLFQMRGKSSVSVYSSPSSDSVSENTTLAPSSPSFWNAPDSRKNPLTPVVTFEEGAAC